MQLFIITFLIASTFTTASARAQDAKRCEYFLQSQLKQKKPLSVLITAGGTKEPIDDVRFISNFSSGAFGRGFALAAAANGHQVVLLAPKELPRLAGSLPSNVELRTFVSTLDLQHRLEEAAKERHWDVVIHSAAVSDYTPAHVTDGKISSNQEELLIRLVKTPKLIRSLRSWFGKSFLVGFKLLSGVAPEERYRVAMKQIGECRTNMCIENDLTEISSASHKARMVTPEGGAIQAPQGPKTEVAHNIWNFIEKRQDVQWFTTVQDQSLPMKVLHHDAEMRTADLLDFAQKAGLLPNNSGNVSVKLENDLIAITPRGVDKSKLSPSDFVVVKVDASERKVFVNSASKPSIDSSISGALYKEFPNTTAILHSHSPWFLGATETRFPFPCGVKEEGEEVIRTVKAAGHVDGNPFLVRLIDHGYMLGLTATLSPTTLRTQWKEALEDQKQHWDEVRATEEELEGGNSVAILGKKGVIGTIRIHSDKSISPRLLPQYQGQGYGKELLHRIKELGLVVKTVDECKVVQFYKDRGFNIINQKGRSIYLK